MSETTGGPESWTNPTHARVHDALSSILMMHDMTNPGADGIYYKTEINGIDYGLTNYGAYSSSRPAELQDDYKEGLRQRLDPVTLTVIDPHNEQAGMITYFSAVPSHAFGMFKMMLQGAGVPKDALESDKPVVIKMDSLGSVIVGNPADEAPLADFLAQHEHQL